MTVSLKLDTPSADSFTRKTLNELSLAVAKSKRIIVITGAGISCSCGIPDFRSSDGLYSLVKQKYPDVVLKGRELFDAGLFRDPTSTSVFYTFISQLKRSIDVAAPSPTHRFIETLDAKKKLLRSYTQNIDGLEARAGLLGSSSQEVKTNGKGKARIRTKEVRNVQLHGDIHRVRCTFCAGEFPCTESYLDMFGLGRAPDCPECTERSNARVARSARPLKVGTLRPAIVLYGEPHPLGDDIGSIQTADMARKPDMLIIMGTSLKVHGLKRLIKDFARVVRASAPSLSSPVKRGWAGKVVFVNKTPPSSEWADVIDYHVAGDTDKWVAKVLEDWKKSRPADWEIQQTLIGVDGDTSANAKFKVAKTGKTASAKAKSTKKPCPNQENIPPPREDVSVSIPSFDRMDPSKPSQVLVPPSTPSKRRQATSHYCDTESSPSKKRDIANPPPELLPEERGLLFGNNINADHTQEKLSMKDAKSVKGCRSRARPGTTEEIQGNPSKVRKAKSQVWVEIDLTQCHRPLSRCR